MPKVSVIVPVYKVESYLRKCVDSILGQSFSDFEVILVDDGSPDNCGAICDDYATRDQRVKVIHKINGGLSDARNVGLDAAIGQYICFVDSDDWIEQDLLKDNVAVLSTAEQIYQFLALRKSIVTVKLYIHRLKILKKR